MCPGVVMSMQERREETVRRGCRYLQEEGTMVGAGRVGSNQFCEKKRALYRLTVEHRTNISK